MTFLGILSVKQWFVIVVLSVDCHLLAQFTTVSCVREFLIELYSVEHIGARWQFLTHSIEFTDITLSIF